MSLIGRRIKLNGADITNRCAPAFAVEENESASGLFDFEYHPAAGPVMPESLALATVTLELSAPGYTSGYLLVFTGKVIDAPWHPKQRAYRIRASSRLQEHIRGLGSLAAVAAEIPGSAPTDAVTGTPGDDLWTYAEACLETVPSEIHMTPAGTMAVVDIGPKATADWTLTSADIDSSADMQLEIAKADDLVNRVELELTYTVNRRKIREHDVSWDFRDVVGAPGAPSTFCVWFQGADHMNWTLPILDEVRGVFEGSSWNVPGGMEMTEPPFGVANLCYEDMPQLDWYLASDSHPLLSAAAHGYQALACEIREVYQITVTCSGAQTLYGATVTERRTGNLQVPDPGVWPPAKPGPMGGSVDSVGDTYTDMGDEAGRLAMLQSGYQWGATKITRGQRSHALTITSRLRPDITLAHTVAVSCWGVTAKGKVSRVQHTLSPPRTVLTLSLSRGGGGTSGTWEIPDRPDSSNPAGYWATVNGVGYTYPAVDSSTDLPTYVGGLFDSTPSDELGEVDGWITNVTQQEPDPEQYPELFYSPVFRFTWPGIEQEASAGMEFSVPVTVDVAIPNDTLTLT